MGAPPPCWQRTGRPAACPGRGRGGAGERSGDFLPSGVEAARATGCDDRRIILRHLLPNLLSPIVVLATLEVAYMILTEAALSFLGLGIQPPLSSWGLMLSRGRQYITTAWWLVTFPGIAILLTALSLNLLATWARGVSDPAQRWR